MVASQHDLQLRELILRAFLVQGPLDLDEVFLLNGQDSAVLARVACILPRHLFAFLRLEEDLLAGGPPDRQPLPDRPHLIGLLLVWPRELAAAEQHEVE